MEQKEKRISARKVIFTSFTVDLLDVFFSIIVAILTGSVIMLTQVLEGISDLASSGLLLIGLARASQKADRQHPFGYGRELYFWTLLAALIMFGISSVLSFYFGWKRFQNPERIHDTFFAFAILFITLFTNGYAFFLSYRRLLRKRGMRQVIRIFYRSTLVETKATFILDLMGTVASFVGIAALGVYAATGDLRYDGIGGHGNRSNAWSTCTLAPCWNTGFGCWKKCFA